MISIRVLCQVNSEYIKALADLHKRAFPMFFLTQLGIPFLSTLYAGYLESPDSGIIIAENEEILVGFIAYSNDYQSFYKGLVKHHLMQFAICSLRAVIRHPTFIKRLFGAFKKSDNVAKEEKYVELSSICVDPKFEGRGIGSDLINYLKEMVDFNIYTYINLETDADRNDAVNMFYVNNGFVLARTFTTAEGRRMNEYRYARAS